MNVNVGYAYIYSFTQSCNSKREGDRFFFFFLQRFSLDSIMKNLNLSVKRGAGQEHVNFRPLGTMNAKQRSSEQLTVVPQAAATYLTNWQKVQVQKYCTCISCVFSSLGQMAYL